MQVLPFVTVTFLPNYDSTHYRHETCARCEKHCKFKRRAHQILEKRCNFKRSHGVYVWCKSCICNNLRVLAQRSHYSPRSRKNGLHDVDQIPGLGEHTPCLTFAVLLPPRFSPTP